MKPAKQYLNELELCNHLKTHKNILDIHENRELIQERSYASSITPYKHIFATGINHLGKLIYQESVYSSHYLKLIQIDEKFGSKFSNLIGRFERKLKLQIVNRICMLMNESGDTFCIHYIEKFKSAIDNYYTSKTNSMPYNFIALDEIYTKSGRIQLNKSCSSRINLLTKLINHGSNMVHAKNTLIRHYQNKYDIVPFWLLVQILTFGELVILFGLLSNQDRFLITYTMTKKDRLYIRDVIVFERQIEQIRILRNIINHYEPIFPYFINCKDLNIFKLLLLFDDRNELNTSEIDLDIDCFMNSFNKKHITRFVEFKSLLNKRQ